METMISYCGLHCESCPIHLATLEQDKSRQRKMRELIAEQCSKMYGMNTKIEDVTDCDGCSANTERLFSGCSNCEIRKCTIRKNNENCVYCSDYPCDRLRKHFLADADAKARLNEIRHANNL